ncbi:hypothetical protein G6M89_03735 [Natronolimnobius sp. AArcel1]|uniref:DUF7562 family protein n=1 Tax=Natronolimnobius sp. AArcel1 TaxID=1679093 RepID=UPI0013EA67A0|nr:hypothetical protein [Natronolimnobius sp. AArcel1]NGM68130.1 hypothetical protein [Natronolimnobius sp. AArcel1]
MWPWSSRNRMTTVTCLACGDETGRSMAREYDKYGNRWDREDKAFEYLCKTCHRDLCHHPRGGLEDLLIELEAGERDQEAFLRAYLLTVQERQDRVEERREWE